MGEIFRKKLLKKKSETQSQEDQSVAAAFASDAEKSAIVINSISDGIAIVDARGIIQLFNPAASHLTGWSHEDAENLDYRSIFQFLDSDDRQIPDEQNPIAGPLKSGETVEREDLFLQTASKKKLAVSIKITPVTEKIILSAEQKKQSKDNVVPLSENITQITGAVVVFRDVTREKADQNAQTEFISTASHEMRTPVAIIEGYLGMLMNPNTATVDSRGMSYAKKAHEAAEHLGNLFQDLLDVTAIDDRRINTKLDLVDAGAAIKQIVEDFQIQAKEKGISLVLENTGIDGDAKVVAPLYIIYVDVDQLKEILGNIIDNAIKYTRKGSVKVSVSADQKRVRFSVIDTGIGISAEDVPHLFQKFYRIDNGDTREVGGTGLGLYLIKKLTENLGGQVGVESDYGKGSTFWVEFDRLSRDQAVAKAEEIQRQKKP
ncbi:PAS domain-containing sensor histidine kinase [Candidatus Saccharibacteria bacterium]|nr:PAS domain-containing sensor histidine kinase [Candidatus Saccharibacteria bacterium]